MNLRLRVEGETELNKKITQHLGFASAESRATLKERTLSSEPSPAGKLSNDSIAVSNVPLSAGYLTPLNSASACYV
jgi:hypothetical protein